MAFTIVGYDMARADAVAALAVVTPVADQHVTIDGNNVIVPSELSNLIGEYAAHGTGAAGSPTLAQLQSPALRRTFNPDIPRLHDSLAALSDEHINMHPESPVPLDKGEGLQAWLANGAVVAARGLVGVFFADGSITPVHGAIFTLRYTTVTPAAANAWSLGTLTVIQALPAGRYQLVGARVDSAGDCGLFRLVLTGHDWRPGGVITTGPTVGSPNCFRYGNLGVWGEFDDRHLPRIEILSIVGVANPAVCIDLIKVA